MSALLAQRIANAPCSWGVLEFDLPGEKIGYAQVLDEIRDTGYSGTELGDWGFMPTNPTELRGQLQARGLALLGAFVPVDFSNPAAHAGGEERAVQTAQLMVDAVGAGPFIVLADENGKNATRTRNAGRISHAHELSADAWRVFCQGVNRVAAAVRQRAGLRSVFHHHCAGFVETPWEIERLLRGTDPDLVGLCFDTGHYRFGGGADPIAAYRQMKHRIWHVHFKDCEPSVAQRSRAEQWDYFQALKRGVFCELGRGDVPFSELVQELEQSQFSGWIVVEQDVLPGMGAPRQYAASNRQFLRTCGL